MINPFSQINKRVAVIGANGYLGSSLVAELIKEDYEVTRVSRKIEKVIPNSFAVSGDLCDASFCRTITEKNDVIFLLSGNTSIKEAENDPMKNLVTNVFPIINIIKAARELRKVPRIIFASTATIYGLTPDVPIKETYVPKPITNYDLHKLFGEQQLNLASELGYVEGISLRLANVYGPSSNQSSSIDRGIINKATLDAINGKNLTLYGDGNQIRDYIYISDAINAIKSAGANYKLKNGTFNVASGSGTKMMQVFELIKKYVKTETGQKIQINQIPWPELGNGIDRRNFTADILKIKREIGWVPTVTIKEGIDLLIHSLLRTKV
jgi:nucleoside-diphosphate-sugar epimerase